jgi:hypothetical protein
MKHLAGERDGLAEHDRPESLKLAYFHRKTSYNRMLSYLNNKAFP